MNCQELATAAVEGLDTKVMILNNQHLGMVVQWEDRFYKANRAHTYLGKRDCTSPLHPPTSFSPPLLCLCSCILEHCACGFHFSKSLTSLFLVSLIKLQVCRCACVLVCTCSLLGSPPPSVRERSDLETETLIAADR
jgi:hypothetical protein